jgi:L-cysteine:1D-myo-inositol 2-amino-2-deoxy-alpha-D-glucopyranoside ligase
VFTAGTLDRPRSLADDLDSPAALAAVDAWAGRVLAGDDEALSDAHAVAAVDALLGVDLQDRPPRGRS